MRNRLSSVFKENPFFVKNIQWVPAETDNLLKLLPTVIGENRYQRILHRKYIQKKNPFRKKLQLLSSLIIGMADIHFEDMNELFLELKNPDKKEIRHLTQKETRFLQENFDSYNHCDELSKPLIDLLMFVLVPVKSLDDLFLNQKKPVISNKCAFSGETLQSVSRLVLYLNYIRLAKSLTPADYWFILGKRIIDREPCIDTVIPHANGYYRIIKNIYTNSINMMRGGAYIAALEPISTTGPNHITDAICPLLICRGTRPPFISTSGHRTIVDNLRSCQGSDGIIASFEAIIELFNQKKWTHQSVWISGMSLGGGHAQRLALALLTQGIHVAELFVVSGIGIESESLDRFKVLALKPKKIHYFIDLEDPTFILGAGHLGLGCENLDIDLWCVASKNISEAELTKSYADMHTYDNNSHIKNMTCLFKGLSNIHCTHRVWYEESNRSHVIKLTQSKHSEDIQFLLNNRAGLKGKLEASRKHFILCGNSKKFIDFLEKIDSTTRVEVPEKKRDLTLLYDTKLKKSYSSEKNTVSDKSNLTIKYFYF